MIDRETFCNAIAWIGLGPGLLLAGPGRLEAQSGYATSVVVQVRRANQALVPGATVELRDGNNPRVLARGTSNASGVAEFRNIGAGQYTAYAGHLRYGSAASAPFAIKPGGGVARPRVILPR